MKITQILDKIEDGIRSKLSHYPILYALIAGIGIVSFWRGVWGISDQLELSPETSLLLGFLILLTIGVLVTEFLGNRIIISGLRGEKKIEEKTLEEIEIEEMSLVDIRNRVINIEKILKELNEKNEKGI